MSFRRRLKLGILVISWDLRLRMHILRGTKSLLMDKRVQKHNPLVEVTTQNTKFESSAKTHFLVYSWDLCLKMHILKGTKVSMPTQSKLAEKGGGSEKYRKGRNGCYAQVD